MGEVPPHSRCDHFARALIVALAAAAALLGETVGWLEIGFALLVVAIVALGWRMRVARRH